MQIQLEVEKLSQISYKLKVRVPSKQVKQALELELLKVQRTAGLKGFRKGQIPISIVKQAFGESINHQVYHDLIDKSYEECIKMHQLRPVGRPKIEPHTEGIKSTQLVHQGAQKEAHEGHTVNEQDDLVYTANFEVFPEIKVQDYLGIELQKLSEDISEAQVDSVIERLREEDADLVPVLPELEGSRLSQINDFVDITFKGFLIKEDGTLESSSISGLSGNKMIELGSQSFIPGFEAAIIGMQRGSSKTFRLQFPSDYADIKLQSKDVEFAVTLNEIKEKSLPPLDGSFAESKGADSVSALREKVRSVLSLQMSEASEQQLSGDLLASLIAKNPFELPNVLVLNQMQQLAKVWAEDLKERNIEQKLIQKILNDGFSDLKIKAEAQVRASLLLQAISEQEKIEISTEELEEEINAWAKAVQLSQDEAKDYLKRRPAKRDDIEFNLLQTKTLKFLIKAANTSIKEVS